MSRRHTGPIPTLAFSPTKCATALGVSYQHVIKPAIEDGRLGPVYLIHGKRRIAVADLEKYLRSFPISPTTTRRSAT